MLEVAKGLQYLHSFAIPHGNLKGVSDVTPDRANHALRHSNLPTPPPQANVLIGEDGHVRLTDYGFAPINSHIVLTAAEPAAGNMVWLAPEIISGGFVESMPADIFAFGMLAFEILTGRLPFEGQGRSRAASLIHKGDRPRFPQEAEQIGLTIRMREFLGMCWHQDPSKRPEIDEVVRTWERFLGNNESVQQLSIDQSHLEPVLGDDYQLDEPQPARPGEHLLPSTDIASLLT